MIFVQAGSWHDKTGSKPVFRYAVALPSPAPNSIPCASGSSPEKLIVFV
jgi:hypothetical protein